MRKKENPMPLVRSLKEANYTNEYNCNLWRLFPWKDQVETHRAINGFGAILVHLDPGKQVDAHSHDEEEAFIVISGNANLKLDDVNFALAPGDVAYIPRLSRHQLINNSRTERFTMVDLYWDAHP